MPRHPRSVLPDYGVFHVYGRGVARMQIFFEPADYDLFWGLLADAGTRFLWKWHAACLMPNHYHLLVETPLEGLSRGMHRVNGCYARYFNNLDNRVGHVFQSRFGANSIEDDDYLEKSIRYVSCNAQRSGLCATPGEWPWASLGHPLRRHSATSE